MNWQQRLRDWQSLFFYADCPLCGRPAPQSFCRDCLQRLRSCQGHQPQQFWRGELPVLAWGSYGGSLKQAIAALKYENQPQIARPLGQWLASCWLDHRPIPGAPIVVPIPLHPEREQQRGYNQATLIAQSFCAVTGFPLRSQGLQRQRPTQAQHQLTPRQREQNLHRAFSLGPDFATQRPSRPVLLLDDIYTTGATARAARASLKAAGNQVCGLIAVARAGGDR